ncbi:MAG TPA: Mut7-C RNAse domain-containing protein [Mesotoga sp.]|jgi:uncharacterized protein with PIN domain|nr:hypothetical protein [Mesotoga sp.]MDI9376038.1 Mut7-C RNAse domain-containing protein [Thermotogota bacterium]NLX34386.1 hypothetical protein [Thermotogaceae bacterium]MDD4040337.1 Mut7-C RNAse domain-containing protein [Mesotoga sp.]MDD4477737.1 Mut7-C RNAse domain-containing protein [Mesotoga sp.]
MKFLVDESLSKLGRKLRILGLDTVVCGWQTFDSSLTERDIFLTTSKRFLERAIKSHLRCYLLKSSNWRSQLKSVFQRYSIRVEGLKPFSRCSVCNGELEEASSEDLCSVPEYVMLNNENLRKCKNCGRVYWKGSHVEHMRSLYRIVAETSGDKTEQSPF